MALTTLHMAVPLFTQNTSIPHTFTLNHNISIVRGQLTHWSAPTSAIYIVIRNCLGSAREPETDLCSNSRWACVYVYVCVYVCCVDAECAHSTTYGGQTEFREMGESLCHCWTARCGLWEDSLDGTMRAQHALPAPALSERESTPVREWRAFKGAPSQSCCDVWP